MFHSSWVHILVCKQANTTDVPHVYLNFTRQMPEYIIQDNDFLLPLMFQFTGHTTAWCYNSVLLTHWHSTVLLTLYSVIYTTQSYWHNTALLILYRVTDPMQCYWHYTVLITLYKVTGNMQYYWLCTVLLTLQLNIQKINKYPKNLVANSDKCSPLYL